MTDIGLIKDQIEIKLTEIESICAELKKGPIGSSSLINNIHLAFQEGQKIAYKEILEML